MRRPAKIAAVLAATVAVAGSAFAYWSAAGAGTGAGTTSAPAALTVTAATTTQLLLPTGAATGDVSLTITNPNSYSVHLTQLSLDSAAGNGGFSANATGCALSFATQDNGGGGWTFPSGSTNLVLTNSMTMGTGAASICQNRTFSVYLKAS
jgi:hypothetical protein